MSVKQKCNFSVQKYDFMVIPVDFLWNFWLIFCYPDESDQGSKNDADPGSQNDADLGGQNDADLGGQNDADPGGQNDADLGGKKNTMKYSYILYI